MTLRSTYAGSEVENSLDDVSPDELALNAEHVDEEVAPTRLKRPLIVHDQAPHTMLDDQLHGTEPGSCSTGLCEISAMKERIRKCEIDTNIAPTDWDSCADEQQRLIWNVLGLLPHECRIDDIRRRIKPALRIVSEDKVSSLTAEAQQWSRTYHSHLCVCVCVCVCV